MRALFMMPLWPGPSELWLHRMIEAMGSSVVAVATYASPVGVWEGRLPVLSLLPVPDLFARRPRLALAAGALGASSLRRIVDRWDITTILCNYIPCALRFRDVWEQCAVPLFVHCHGFDITWDLRLSRWPHPRRFRSGYRCAVRTLADRAVLIANSLDSHRRLMNLGVAPERAVVKYLGVPVPDRCQDRSMLGKRVHFLYLGRLVDFKGPELTIRAFDLACRQGLDGTLTLAGDGPLRRLCERERLRSRFADRIHLIGATTAAQGEQLRSLSDVFTAHNRTGPVTRQEEALGVSILEAMAAGLPVVTGRSGGVTETVIDGQTGLLFDPGDVEAHAEALLLLASDPQLRLRQGRAGWARTRDHFSHEREHRRLDEILGGTCL